MDPLGVGLRHRLAGLILAMPRLSVFVALRQTLSGRHQEVDSLCLPGPAWRG